MLRIETNIHMTIMKRSPDRKKEEEENAKEEKRREEKRHHKLGKSWISKEQSPKVCRSKSSIASTSRSNVELGNAVWEWGCNSKSIVAGRVESWLKRRFVEVEVEFGVEVGGGGGDDDEVGEGIGEEIDGGVERTFRRSLCPFDLFIWCLMMATTIRRNNGLDRSIVFNCLFNFVEMIWSNS